MLPKALKSCPKSNKPLNLVALVGDEAATEGGDNIFDQSQKFQPKLESKIADSTKFWLELKQPNK